MVGPIEPMAGYSLPGGNIVAGSYLRDLISLESCVPPTQTIQWPCGPIL